MGQADLLKTGAKIANFLREKLPEICAFGCL